MNVSKLSALGFRRSALIVGALSLAVLSGPWAKTKQQAGVNLKDARSIFALYGADAAGIDRAARDFIQQDQIQWKGRPNSVTQSAILFGDPTKPGLYAQLLKRGPNDWSEAHYHANDRIITVLAETMLIGTGPIVDRKNVVAVKAGGFIKDFAHQPHYDGTGPEGMTIEIIGMGPNTSTPVNEK